MEKLTTVFEIENMINRILSERQTELAQLDEQISSENAAIAAANAAMDKATAAGDLQAYKMAKADRASAADGKEMHEARKAALNDKPLISEAEYKKACAEICAEIAAIDDKTKQELTALSDKMNAAAMALREAINRANDVLARLQHDLFRDADRSRNKETGAILPINHEVAHVNPEFYSTVEWGKAGAATGAYQRYTGRKG